MYHAPYQFEPVRLDERQLAQIQPMVERIATSSLRLTHAAHETSRATLRELIRSMNSFYSNRIEGQSTHPRHIEKALRNDFSDQPDIARLQRIAKAHIEAEKELEPLAAGPPALTSAFLIDAHRAVYSRLSAEDRISEENQLVIPGALRSRNVQMSRHIPPDAASLPAFLKRLDEMYGHVHGWEGLLVAAACAHHRVAWVHPFLDGNGRTTRLQTHCALWPLSAGLWSPSRGFARSAQAYYAALHNADSSRRGDLDGRGNLSAQGLLEWVKYFLDLCDDQVSFMSRMLALDGMRQRIEALVIRRSTQDKAVRREAVIPLHHVFAAGPITRGEFSRMTGLGERTAQSLLGTLIQDGLLVSETPKGPVRLGLPLDALHMLFPNLYPEANLPL